MAGMQPLVEYRDRFGGFETRVLELEGDGPPLVFLHGYADSADTWRLVLAELAKRDRRAIAFDFPGFGRADRLSRDEPVLPQLDRFTAAVLRSFDEPVVAVGNSLGGCAVLRAAERDDLPLAAIVPVGPAGLGLAPWLDMIESNPLVSFVLMAGAPLPAPVVQTFVARAYRMLAFAPRAAVDPLVVRTFAAHFADASTVRRYLDVARRLLGELHDPFDLSAVAVPTLAIWGRHDAMVPHSGSRRLLDGIPGSRLELMDACGHCPQVEDPAGFTELVLEFAASAHSLNGAKPWTRT
jgi:pimeloyl-ACP methyl ester carboxylesterase